MKVWMPLFLKRNLTYKKLDKTIFAGVYQLSFLASRFSFLNLQSQISNLSHATHPR